MPTLHVSLPQDLVEFVNTELADGGYSSESDVIRAGLHALREQRKKRRLLMQLLAEGHAAARTDNTKTLGDRVLGDIAKLGTNLASRRSDV